MIAALIIVFREVIEAGLIVGIVLAVTAGVARRGRWVAAGVAVGDLITSRERKPQQTATPPQQFRPLRCRAHQKEESILDN